MKLAAAILLLLAGALGALWVIYVRAPPPEVVCQHRADLLLADTQGQHSDAVSSLLDHERLTCRKQAAKLLQLRGKIAYARHARCVMSATEYNDAERCG